ncbi:MAG TPA: hypothetical protein VIC57_12260 [Candidatus Dormibacteraeota bacterium]|jgi:proteasome lid subunit RPN8/RPN11
MNELFTALPARSGLPFRPRGVMPPRSRRFRSETGFECFVTPEAVESLVEGTRLARPNEAFALLFGRAFHDDAGEYTVVTGAHHPTSFTRGPARVELSPAEAATARAEGSRRFPAEDAVGWAHSHALDSGYSPTDREEQRTWPGRYHVGILTFMTASLQLRVYHGPSSAPMAELVAPQRLDEGPCWVTGWDRAWCDCPACTHRRTTG